MKVLYAITAYRWGERAEHSYLLGIIDNLEDAKRLAEEHASYRGGKYACVVEKAKLNFFDNDNYPVEVYRAKSFRY